MSKYKSPFIYLEQFLPQMQAMQMVEDVESVEPNRDEKNNPIPLYTENDEVFAQILTKVETIAQDVCRYYGAEYSGVESMSVEWIPAGASIVTHSENSTLVGNKWLKTQNRDFTGVLFLTSHVDATNIHELEDFDCCEGKLQFLNYNFGFLPQAGDLVIYPSDARFANSTSKVLAGDLYQIRFHIVTRTPYIHDISKFPGTYQNWFN